MQLFTSDVRHLSSMHDNQDSSYLCCKNFVKCFWSYRYVWWNWWKLWLIVSVWIIPFFFSRPSAFLTDQSTVAFWDLSLLCQGQAFQSQGRFKNDNWQNDAGCIKILGAQFCSKDIQICYWKFPESASMRLLWVPRADTVTASSIEAGFIQLLLTSNNEGILLRILYLYNGILYRFSLHKRITEEILMSFKIWI